MCGHRPVCAPQKFGVRCTELQGSSQGPCGKMMFRKVGAKKPEAPPAPPPPAAATSDDDDDDDSLASDADSDVAPSSAPPAALAAFQKRGGWSKPAAPAPVPAPAPAAARDSEEDEEDEDEESGSASDSAFPMHKAAPASSSAPSSQPEAEPGSISRTSSGIGRSGEAVSLEEKIAQEVRASLVHRLPRERAS